MKLRVLQKRLGIFACLSALFLGVYAIPQFVSAPSNVQFIILSPVFWPYTLACLTGIVGVLLINSSRGIAQDLLASDEPEDVNRSQGMIRLAVMAVIMSVTMLLLPKLGMVWTCMLVFVATAFLYKTRHPVLAVVCAVLIPLLLYAFFAHVAGVAIPQGDFVRLP